MLMLWNCAQLYSAVLTLRRAQTLYALYMELISFTQLYVELIFFTQLYSALRGANIHYAALHILRSFTLLRLLYAVDCTLHSFKHFTQLYAFYAAERALRS